jgi:hypothetical protein
MCSPKLDVTPNYAQINGFWIAAKHQLCVSFGSSHIKGKVIQYT